MVLAQVQRACPSPGEPRVRPGRWVPPPVLHAGRFALGPVVIPATWAGWREVLGVLAHRPRLRKTVRITLVVGTVLFCVNQPDVG